MKENLELIISICGDQPYNQELIEIGNDPNFVFENNPDFITLRLFDIEGNIINVNSWIECAHYVNGGWSLSYNAGISGDVAVLGIVSIYAVSYLLLKIIRRRKNEV